MSDQRDKQRSAVDAELEREVREKRKFTLEEAVGRMAGPGAMKGESPVPRLQQAEFEIESWVRDHLTDSGGALEVVLPRQINGSALLLDNFDKPLMVLADYCKQVLESDYLLRELVRDTDAEWGRIMGERPVFDQEGVPSQPGDPYTVESVRNTLSELLKQLTTGDCSNG
jgi:hypothetical protein